MRPGSTILIFVMLAAIAGIARADEPWEDPDELEMLPEPDTGYYRYLRARRLKCTGEGAKLERPLKMTIQGRTYTYTGPELVAERPDPDGTVTLGVLGAIKDFNPATRQALEYYLERFAAAKVDAVVLLGDIAGIEYELTQVLLFCARPGWPVLALIGNSESRTAFNRAVLRALRATSNIINMDMIRRVDLGGAVLLGMPGYRDRKYVHQTAGCSYKPQDLLAMSRLIQDSSAPVIFMAHGPPKDAGRRGLDFATEGGNVGDPVMREFLDEQKISFGLFSHILEAGGQARNRRGKPVRSGKWVRSVYLNVGTANPMPWTLNSGRTSCGLASVFRVKGEKASYTWLRHPCGRR